jgi:hypothetical protein
MAPNRLRAAEDSRSESSNTPGRHPAGQGTNSTTAKGKRGGGTNAAGAGSNLKDVTSAADAAAGANAEGGSSGVCLHGLTFPIRIFFCCDEPR